MLAALAVRAEQAPPLTLEQAARLALERNPAAEATSARIKAAGSRMEQARAGYLPKVNYMESAARSNNPVFVFGSLLSQRQFTEANFRVDPLNRPDFLNNFQSLVSVEQTLWDGGQTRLQIRGAELGKSLASEDDRLTRMQLVAGAGRAYLGAVLAGESLRAAREAVKSAEADLARAESVRAAGMSTDADVLAIRVHLASVKEQAIRRGYDLEVARAALNQALGLPLDTPHHLTTPLTAAALSETPTAELETRAAGKRPEAVQAQAAAQMAETQSRAARLALLPQVSARASFEADRQRFVTRAGSNWYFGAALRWNLFNGGADKARIAEAAYLVESAQAQEKRLQSALRLEVRKAMADVKAAAERLELTVATIAMADENLRITKNRFDAGLTTVTELLRSETALLDARTRRLAAIHDQRVATIALDLAAGTLSEESDVLK
jgi:outer membrane protein TolC